MCPQCYFKARRRFTPNGTHSKCRSPAGTGALSCVRAKISQKIFTVFRALPSRRRSFLPAAFQSDISVVSNGERFFAQLIYQFAKQRYRHFFHMLYTTIYRQFRNKLQKHCNFRGSATLSRPVSMQSIQLCRLHSFSLQVYSFRQCRQIVANHKSNICSFFVRITSIYIFLFPIPFVIIFVYNEPCAVRPARCFLIY